VKWVDNFDREKIPISLIQSSCVLDPNILNRRMTLGEIANAMGHKYIYEQIFKNDDGNFICRQIFNFGSNINAKFLID
jgi:hypothetical protein